VCPDVAGRGRSDWLEAKSDYSYAQYCADMTVLIARLTAGVERTLHWVGTSMGALIGIILAARRGTPIRKLVLNDAGIHVPKAALERLGRYVGRDFRFPSLEALEAHVRIASAPFGPLSDEHWRHITRHAARQHEDGSWSAGYDPAIRAPFDAEIADVDLSPYWDAVNCPTLLIRGVQSDVLLRETAMAMAWSGPKARVVEIDGVGHAPMLMVPEQIEIVRAFLLDDPGGA
jgi:pimeloyl-ACP methyl ester carboxylesterase